MNFTN